MKKERETKEYLEFVEQFQAFLILMTEEWGAKVTLQKDGEEEEPEDLLVVELSRDPYPAAPYGVDLPGFPAGENHGGAAVRGFRLSGTMQGD